MSVKIRLARAGAKKAPFYRVVAADSRSRRDGRFLEILGRYNPRSEPSVVELDAEKVRAWIAKGAQPTEVVVKLLEIAEGKREAPKVVARPSKKVAAKDAAAKKAAEAPAPAAEAAPVEAVEETEQVADESAPAEEPVVEAAEVAEEPAEAAEAADEPAAEEPEAAADEVSPEADGAEAPETAEEPAANDAE